MAMLMDIPGVIGESDGRGPDGGKINNDWHEKIQIETMGYGISQRTTQTAGTGLASGGSTVSAMHITKVMDKSTPFLFYYLTSADPIPKLMIRVIQAGNKDSPYGGLYEAETYTLENVIISSYHTSGAMSASGLPLESWSLSFVSINERYQDLENGKPQAQQLSSFNFGTGISG